ncbi:hypothetical protein EC968_003902 [Mortierella alpina]|nr:hypothetical protein EC968_003902 [Mortierella alpina]
MNLKLVVTLLTALAALVALTSAHNPAHGLVVGENTKDFCMLLPTERESPLDSKFNRPKVFCTKKELFEGAESFPTGFILASEIHKYKDYIEVTGVMNRTVLGWDATDNGVKFHDGFPRGLKCQVQSNPEWNTKKAKSFGFIEPNNNHFCFRCCSTSKNCAILDERSTTK